MPKVFPGFQQLCHTGPSEYPHSQQSQSFPWSLKPVWAPSPRVQAEKWYPVVISVVTFLYFAFWTPVAPLPSEILKLPLSPSLRAFPSVQKLFFLQDSLPQVQIMSWNYLPLLLPLPFTLSHSDEILPFWKCSGVLQEFFRMQLYFWYICVQWRYDLPKKIQVRYQVT